MFSQAAAFFGAAALSASLVPVQLHCQLDDTWCYLAVSEMVAEYSGVPLDQCNILRLRNHEPSGAACSCGPTGLVGSPKTVTHHELTGLPLFTELGLKCDGHSWGADHGLDAAELAAKLHPTGGSGEPIAVGISFGSALHIGVLVGITQVAHRDVALWLDPLPKCKSAKKCGARCVTYLDWLRKACDRGVPVEWSVLDVWGLAKAGQGETCDLAGDRPAGVANGSGSPCVDPGESAPPLDGAALLQLLDKWEALSGESSGTGETSLGDVWHDHIFAGSNHKGLPANVGGLPTFARQLVQRKVGGAIETIAVATRSLATGDPTTLGSTWQVCDGSPDAADLAKITGPGGTGHSLTIPELDLTLPLQLNALAPPSVFFQGTWLSAHDFMQKMQVTLHP